MYLSQGNYLSSQNGQGFNSTRGGGDLSSQFKPTSDIFASKYTNTNYGIDYQLDDNNRYRRIESTNNNNYGTNSARNNNYNQEYAGLSRSILMQSQVRNGYTTTGSAMYKCGEQLESRYGLQSANKNNNNSSNSLMDYPKDLVQQQYRQPTYLTKGVYDNYYAGHSDQEMRDQELKTVYNQDINKDREEIKEIFREMTLLEREVEIIKQSLCLQKDLSFDQLFRFFDSESTNQITPYELDAGFRELGIVADKIDLYLVVTRYSRDGNDTINVDEFFKMIAPGKVDPAFDQVYIDKSIAFKDMCDLTRSYAVKLFKMLLNQENIVQQFRKDIIEKQLDIDALFKAFDKDNSQTITRDELLEWMRDNGIYINDNESKQFFQRFDRNNSGQINLSEFRYELTLKSVGLKTRSGIVS